MGGAQVDFLCDAAVMGSPPPADPSKPCLSGHVYDKETGQLSEPKSVHLDNGSLPGSKNSTQFNRRIPTLITAGYGVHKVTRTATMATERITCSCQD
ncbi:hypothetical protein PRIPAC_79250 [Pristionchus pacificus]|uniref:Uncharacterized protein n=1 Tax=Pristionchus pacificus TaxID=54126 RepID=A0A2A6CKM4_PRIPA|nr:hypothetical protein PRIPAC_79250 [Pristionchus pacificus]|eukprot:PDM78638.1 hypothetical protein PRIPAC_31217 [Pristionchus pacificus]